MELTLKHRGKTLALGEDLGEDATVGMLRDATARAVEAEPEKTRLLHAGKMLGSDLNGTLLRDVLRQGNATIVVLASSARAITAVRSGREDITLGPLEEGGVGKGRVAPLYVGAPRQTAQAGMVKTAGGGEEYGFGEVEALQGYIDREGAEAVLRRLASDAGVLRVMRERRWRVGALREMAPRGRVGVDPCLMGYNVGRGREIRLRIRTDDHKGFRSIPQLLAVLAHELAHNVHDAHDVAFKETMRWIERRLANADWRGAGGRTLADGISARPVSTQHIAAAATTTVSKTPVAHSTTTTATPASTITSTGASASTSVGRSGGGGGGRLGGTARVSRLLALTDTNRGGRARGTTTSSSNNAQTTHNSLTTASARDTPTPTPQPSSKEKNHTHKDNFNR